MIYGMQIYVYESRNETAAQHKPISIETLSYNKNQISDDEIEMVADAFKRQIKDILLWMFGKQEPPK